MLVIVLSARSIFIMDQGEETPSCKEMVSYGMYQAYPPYITRSQIPPQPAPNEAELWSSCVTGEEKEQHDSEPYATTTPNRSLVASNETYNETKTGISRRRWDSDELQRLLEILADLQRPNSGHEALLYIKNLPTRLTVMLCNY